jgi:hypothetical protein
MNDKRDRCRGKHMYMYSEVLLQLSFGGTEENYESLQAVQSSFPVCRTRTEKSHRCVLGSIPDQIMLDLRWTKWHWGRFSSRTSASPASSHSTNCYVFISHPTTDAIQLDSDSVVK